MQQKGNYHAETNKEYKLGECDVYLENIKRRVYIEIKGRYSEESYYRAKEQLMRWSKYQKKHNNYGIFYTPERIYLLAKNGKERRLRIR